MYVDVFVDDSDVVCFVSLLLCGGDLLFCWMKVGC